MGSDGTLTAATVLCAVLCYNEESTILRVLQDLAEVCIRDMPVVVIDDGSTDRTSELMAGTSVLAVRHSTNRGYGAAVKTAAAECHRLGLEYLAIFPGDGQRTATDLAKMVKLATSERADLIVGGKALNLRRTPPMRFIISASSRLLARVVWHSTYSDVTSGFKIYRVDHFQNVFNILPDDYSFDVVLSIHAKQLGSRCIQFQATTHYEAYKDSKMTTPMRQAILASLNVFRALVRSPSGVRVDRTPSSRKHRSIDAYAYSQGEGAQSSRASSD
ncbi:MAG: hypothetical protein DLM57_01985 [Pseudonocardiales bacterium]|nr:MAG: hypothetical protein DLM57_01985 [Pseudonocardiales bacterium]